MAVRIRLYPQTGVGANGMGAVSASTFYNTKLQSQQQISNLKLQYERALWNEKLEKVRLEERLKNPYLGAQQLGYGSGMGLGAIGGLGSYGLGAGIPMGGMPIGGMPMGGVPAGFPGSGQSNFTSQTSAGAASQSVSNSNVNNVSSVMQQQPSWGSPFGGYAPSFGGGGFLSGLLGALI